MSHWSPNPTINLNLNSDTNAHKPALLVTLDERIWTHGANQKLGAEQWQTDMLQNLSDTWNPFYSQSALASTDYLQSRVRTDAQFVTWEKQTWGSCGLRSWMLYFTHAITALKTCSSLRTFSSSLEMMSISWLAGSSMNSSLSITCHTTGLNSHLLNLFSRPNSAVIITQCCSKTGGIITRKPLMSFWKMCTGENKHHNNIFSKGINNVSIIILLS